MNNSTILAMLM